jgi:hypothetical protein
MPTISRRGGAAVAAAALMLACAGRAAALEEHDTQPRSVPLSPGAAELADLLGVRQLIERIEHSAPATLESLAARQEIVERTVTASLEIDGVLAEIDSEAAQVNELRAYLEARRDRTIALNTIANIVSGGAGGVVGQILQIHHQTGGSIVGAAAGGGSAVLSALGLRQERGGRQALGVAPNMLARLFDRSAEFHSQYPDLVWRYLDAVPPGEAAAVTRRAALVRDWVRIGRIDAPDQAKGSRKIDLLTSSVTSQRSLGIDVLADRAMMLADVRSRVSLMKRDLGKMMAYLRERAAR